MTIDRNKPDDRESSSANVSESKVDGIVAGGDVRIGTWIQGDDHSKQSAPTNDAPPKEKSKSVLVALIGLVGVIIAAVFGYLGTRSAKPTLAPATVPYRGIVRNHADHKAVKDAHVFVGEDQNVPEQMRTDSDGIFEAQLAPKTETVRLWVVHDGFDIYKSQVKPNRTGMEEIELEPSSTRASKLKLKPGAPTNLKATAQDDGFEKPSVPPVSAETLTNETLRALANDIGNKMYQEWDKQRQQDESCLTSKTFKNNEERKLIDLSCEQRRQQFANDSVGLVADGNFLLQAMRPRIGPMSDEWRNAKFTTVSAANGGLLRDMASKLGP